MSFGYSDDFKRKLVDAPEQATLEDRLNLDLRVRRLSVAVSILSAILGFIAIATIVAAWLAIVGAEAEPNLVVAGFLAGVALVGAIVAAALA